MIIYLIGYNCAIKADVVRCSPKINVIAYLLSDYIEKVQECFTRMFPNLRNLPYRERLSRLDNLSLRARGLGYQLIQNCEQFDCCGC